MKKYAFKRADLDRRVMLTIQEDEVSCVFTVGIADKERNFTQVVYEGGNFFVAWNAVVELVGFNVIVPESAHKYLDYHSKGFY